MATRPEEDGNSRMDLLDSGGPSEEAQALTTQLDRRPMDRSTAFLN